MRTLLAIVILAALGWSGWWWFNASARERALAEWLAARRADGWQAEAAEIRVTGFPNRVDVLIDDLRLADPEAGWSWHASGFQILSLTWKPHQFIVALPGQFERMVAPNVALLRDRRWGLVMVSGLPNDLLKDKATVVIAGRASGRKSPPNSKQEIASIDAAGWKLCQRTGCADYLEWIDDAKKFAWGEDQSEFLK